MIQINDFDLPIQVAEKIIGGTKEVPASMLDKAAYKAEVITRGNCMLCGKELIEGLFFCKECEDKIRRRKNEN